MEWFSNEYGDIISSFTRWKKFYRRKLGTFFFFKEKLKIGFFFCYWKRFFILCLCVCNIGDIGMRRANVQSSQNGFIGMQSVFQITVRGLFIFFKHIFIWKEFWFFIKKLFFFSVKIGKSVKTSNHHFKRCFIFALTSNIGIYVCRWSECIARTIASIP